MPPGDYTIVRSVEIDPRGVWVDYGQEIIGQITVLESGDATIKLATAEQSYSSSGLLITGNVIGATKEFLTNNQIFMLILVGIICATITIILNSYFKYGKRK